MSKKTIKKGTVTVEDMEEILKGNLPEINIIMHLCKTILPFGNVLDGYILRNDNFFFFKLKATGEIITISRNNFAGMRIANTDKPTSKTEVGSGSLLTGV